MVQDDNGRTSRNRRSHLPGPSFEATGFETYIGDYVADHVSVDGMTLAVAFQSEGSNAAACILKAVGVEIVEVHVLPLCLLRCSGGDRVAARPAPSSD